MKYLLALDQGTTSSRAILFDADGRIRGSAQREFEQIYPRSAWVEHDPMEIWSSQSAVIAEAMSRANLQARDIAAVGIANQRETTLVWDRQSGQPICNAIVWQDRRTAGMVERLKEDGLEAAFQSKTGLLLDPYFSATKMRWILDNVQGARQRAERGDLAFGTVDSWLAWRLTGGKAHVTDASNASRTLLMNIHQGNWDDELLELLEIPRQMLPEIRSSSEVSGECQTSQIAGVPLAGMAGDQQAALFGQACFQTGMAKNTYGTGSFLLMQTGSQAVRSRNRLLTTVAWKIGGKTEYALEGSIFISGAVVQWLRDGLHLVQQASRIEELAKRVQDSDGVYLVPAFAGLGAPHWDPNARGLIIGITRGTTDAHLARAALDSICFQSLDVLSAMAKDAGVDLTELRVDGGASRNDLLMQIQADVLQRPVVRPLVTETTALGAAYLAGLAVGYYPDRDAIAQHWAPERRFEPGEDADAVAQRVRNWRRALERSRNWIDATEKNRRGTEHTEPRTERLD